MLQGHIIAGRFFDICLFQCPAIDIYLALLDLHRVARHGDDTLDKISVIIFGEAKYYDIPPVRGMEQVACISAPFKKWYNMRSPALVYMEIGCPVHQDVLPVAQRRLHAGAFHLEMLHGALDQQEDGQGQDNHQ